ncbi:hypothetical protein J7L29_07925 [Candidatus Bathyarchaeota archaeon]|nr:hypothetical protein [Candidatus Bathyarchaeota archaeon]
MFSLRLPSRFQKFIRVPTDRVCEALRQTLSNMEEGEEDSWKIFWAIVEGGIGTKVNLRIMPEGEVSSLNIGFSYQKPTLILIGFLAAFIGLGVIFSPFLLLVGIPLATALIYKIHSAVNRFLGSLNELLHGLEAEYMREKLMEERSRWQRSPKDVSDLYRRLREKHIKMWGNTFALEYKINEYQRRGLTREEAIRKVADEEGIF